MKKENSDKENRLLDAIVSGDEKAFADLYKIYYRKLYLFLTQMHKNQDNIVRDILQETFLRVWLNRDKLVEIENFQAWIYKVVSMENLTYIKKELHVKTKTDRLVSHVTHTGQTAFIPKNIEIAEIRSLVQAAVKQMPEQRQRIYLLSREQGMSPSEIAETLNISTNTVYNTLTSALKQIREQLRVSGYSIHLSILFILKFF